MSDLVKGMMLLDPEGVGGHPELWVVASPKTLLRYSQEGITATGSLTKSGMPDGWVQIDTERLASELALDGTLLNTVKAVPKRDWRGAAEGEIEAIDRERREAAQE